MLRHYPMSLSNFVPAPPTLRIGKTVCDSVSETNTLRLLVLGYTKCRQSSSALAGEVQCFNGDSCSEHLVEQVVHSHAARISARPSTDLLRFELRMTVSIHRRTWSLFQHTKSVTHMDQHPCRAWNMNIFQENSPLTFGWIALLLFLVYLSSVIVKRSTTRTYISEFVE